ncbi:MAG: DUF4249 family protein [Mangrovibacterium sp.]|nr:DUF4249 family protein [Mangrovibacterium sp.]
MKKFFNFVLAALFLTACTEEIDLSLKSHGTRMLVVEGQITTDTTAHWIKLSYTSDYYQTGGDDVENAMVSVSDGTETYLLTEDAGKKGLFKTTSGFYGVPGRTYTLTISGIDSDGDGVDETYTSESTMPGFPVVDSIRVAVEHKFYTDVLQISYYAQEPPTPNDAYLYRASVNQVMVTDSLHEWSFTDDGLFNGQRIEDEPVIYLDQEIEQYKVNNGDEITLEVSRIPHAYYQFLYDALWEYWGSDPFGGTPANIRTNISGPRKAWGFFTTYATVRKTKILKLVAD